MKKHESENYMTVGEVAKKMDVTVRTMQYYDKEGLLSPSSESEGGRRLYTYKDVVKLHQILSMKHLGFSLNDIKSHLVSLDTPSDVAFALTEQATVIREKIQTLNESLKEIEILKDEVLQMQKVDFKRYADIIINLQMKNEFYWLIKHFDEDTMDSIRSRFDKDSGLAMIQRHMRLNDEAIQLQTEGVLPESTKGQEFAKEFWDMVLEFTAGDMSLLPMLAEAKSLDGISSERKEKMKLAHSFIESSLEVYFSKLGYNPFEAPLKEV